MSVEIGEQMSWEGEKPQMKEAKTLHSCGQCPFVYTELKQITKHVKTAPGHKQLCVPCNSRFSNFANLRHHLRRYHFNTGEFVCNECGKVSYSEQASYLHWNFVHKVDEGREPTWKKYCALYLKLCIVCRHVLQPLWSQVPEYVQTQKAYQKLPPQRSYQNTKDEVRKCTS